MPRRMLRDPLPANRPRPTAPALGVDKDGNRMGPRQVAGPAPASTLHQRLQAMEAQSRAPRQQPTLSAGEIGTQPSSPDRSPTADLSAVGAAGAIQRHRAQISEAVDNAS